MEYVLTEAGNIKIGAKGKPLVKGTDGKEFEIDAIGASDRITTLNSESAKYRKEATDAKKDLEAFTGIEDPAAALAAIQTVASMGDKQKVELDTLKGTINDAWKVKETAWGVEKQTLNNNLFEATTGSKFATSEVIKKTVLTPDIAAKFFGHHFNPDGTAQFEEGMPLYSIENPGEMANFDEAMTQIINAYPGKDSILKGSGADGSDGHTTSTGGGGNTEVSPRDNIKAGLKARGIS